MKPKSSRIIFLFLMVNFILIFTGIWLNGADKKNLDYKDLKIEDFTIYAFSQTETSEEDPQVYDLDPEINIRATQKWSIWGDDPGDYNFDVVKNYHDRGIVYIGGGTASVIFKQDFKTNEIFEDMAGHDANNEVVPHDYIVKGAYRGSLANPKFRQYIIDFCKIQIDGGVDGLFLDEVNGGFSGGVTRNWNGNEGFDDYFIADFNKFLMEKYPGYTAKDWKEKFGMTDDNIIKKNVPYNDLVNNFNYRKYLKAKGWNGKTSSDGPFVSQNPLAAEWGWVSNNRMYGTDDTFTGKYTKLYWKEIVTELRSYAKQKYNKNILITSNGIFPFVDFNSLGMYTWNPDEQTPDYKGADYVPAVDGHLNGSKSLMSIFKTMKNKSNEISGNVPLVIFIDWPTEMMDSYNKFPVEERKDYWRIFGAEAYAAGIFPAFHLKDTVGGLTATAAGMMDFFKEYIMFYRNNADIYHNVEYSDNTVEVSANNIEKNLMVRDGGKKFMLHLINHNYNRKILKREKIKIKIDLNKKPGRVYMISPDFNGMKNINHSYSNKKLSFTIDKIEYYNVIIIE